MSGPGGYSSTIGAALAQDGDTIRGAAGTYLENVHISRTVTLEGGWNSDFSVRAPALYVTTTRPANLLVAVVTI